MITLLVILALIAVALLAWALAVSSELASSRQAQAHMKDRLETARVDRYDAVERLAWANHELGMLRAARESEREQLQAGPLFAYVDASVAPTGPHPDLDAAYAEAEELARAFPGQRVHVLAPYGLAEQPPTHPVWSGLETLLDEIESRGGRL